MSTDDSEGEDVPASPSSTSSSPSEVLSVQTLKIIKLKKIPELASHYQCGDIVDQINKRPRKLMSAPTSSSLSTINTRTGKPLTRSLAKPLIEVFSVSLEGVNMDCLVRGSLIMYNCQQETTLYRRDLKNVEDLESNGLMISLERNLKIDADAPFSLQISLRECSKSFNVGEGYIDLNKSEIEKYWNKRLCSVVKGEFGFVAVHYTPFKAALVAHVEVTFVCSISTIIRKIYGSLTASYGACAYSTFHDKKYFRSGLFNMLPSSDEEDSEELVCDGTRFVAATSIVAIPEDSSLIIQGSLHGGKSMSVYLNVETWPDLNKSSTRIEGENCFAIVSVMWESHNTENDEINSENYEVAGMATMAEIVEEDTPPKLTRPTRHGGKEIEDVSEKQIISLNVLE